MPTGRIQPLLDDLSRAALLRDGGPSDGQLLSHFLSRQDGNAFAALLRRHGRMVLGVCRRVLGNAHDAEDAFQATFLVLVRKAASITARESVAGWLYRVAYRAALEARGRIARRRTREQPLMDLPDLQCEPREDWSDVLPLLDRELDRLPEKHRLAVILCDLQGRTRKEAARHLQIPEGTLSSRLANARKILARRLSGRGVALSAGALAAALARDAASAAVPVTLQLSTTMAATSVAAGSAVAAGLISAQVAALTEGVLKVMFLAKLKMATAVLVGVAVLGLGTGGVLYRANAQPGTVATAQADGDRAKEKKEKPRTAESERERALRKELEAARALLEQLKAQVEEQQKRADVERKRAEEAAAEARSQLAKVLEAERKARQQAEQARYIEQIAKAQAEFEKTGKVRPKESVPPDRKLLSAAVQQKKAALMNEYEAKRRALQRQLDQDLQALDVQLKEDLGQLDSKRSAPKQSGDKASTVADRLDRILDRLERLEERLERLERRRPEKLGK
jgi:RNA polymerase sigma factor (sigma-70 family)